MLESIIYKTIYICIVIMKDLEEKKVLGSGGYAFVYFTEDEELKFTLGLLHSFFANIGRIDKKRFTKYYCKQMWKRISRLSINST